MISAGRWPEFAWEKNSIRTNKMGFIFIESNETPIYQASKIRLICNKVKHSFEGLFSPDPDRRLATARPLDQSAKA